MAVAGGRRRVALMWPLRVRSDHNDGASGVLTLRTRGVIAPMKAARLSGEAGLSLDGLKMIARNS